MTLKRRHENVRHENVRHENEYTESAYGSTYIRNVVSKCLVSVALTAIVGASASVAAFAREDGPVMPDDFVAVITDQADTQDYKPERPERSVLYATDRLNLREGAGTVFGVITILPLAAEVTLVDYAAEGADSTAWSKVSYGGAVGFVKTEFLTDKKPELPKVSAVELLPWSTVKTFLPIGADLPILDIRTGITYKVRSFSNGAHADVEPVTKDDTALLKMTFGGVWDWDGRPVVVTVGSRRIAAAINGMPHGGGVNADNGMNGQVCLHFYGSQVHNGNRSYERELQNVVNWAYNLTH